MNELEPTIYSLVNHANQVGHEYLIRSVNRCNVLGKYPHRELTTLVYQPIADELGLPLYRVTKGICRSMDDIWSKHDHTLLNQIFGQQLVEKPSPGELIFHLYRFLRHSQE